MTNDLIISACVRNLHRNLWMMAFRELHDEHINNHINVGEHLNSRRVAHPIYGESIYLLNRSEKASTPALYISSIWLFLSCIMLFFENYFQPLRYLLTICLGPVFSLRWSLPSALGCTPKQLDSLGRPRTGMLGLLLASPFHRLSLDQEGLGLPQKCSSWGGFHVSS